MNTKKTVFLIHFLMAAATLTAQQQRTPLPESLTALSPVKVFSSDTADEHAFADGRKDVPRSSFTVKSDEQGRPLFDVLVQAASKSHYGVSVHWKTTQGVRKGDVLLARLSMRTLSARQESGESAVYFFFQQATPPHNKSFINQLGTGNEWKTFDIPFIAAQDFQPGEASIGITFGTLPQNVELTGVEILNFGNKVTIDQLPETRFTYAGREENAAWRQEALRRIENIRTAPLHIKVVDEAGKPVKGANVEAQLTQSEFVWGTAVNETLLGSEQPDSENYRHYFSEFFNSATIENGFKTYGWAWDIPGKRKTLHSFEWLVENGFRQRGHTLVWPAWKFNPSTTRELAQRDTAAFNRFIKAQFYERMAISKGHFMGWDVINELMHEKEFFAYLPEDIVVEWFQLARQLDPDAQLFINEYGMLNGLQSPANITSYLETIKALIQKGAPIDAIGIQGHVGRQPRDPEQVITDLDLFRDLRLPVQITEFDINTPDEELQADYIRDFMIAVYSHPMVTGVTLWGFWEAQHWKPDAGLFRRDWSPKPSAAAWREWVIGKWKTRVSERTDKKGEVNSRGHLGRYSIRIEYKGKIIETEYQLTTEPEKIIISLR